MAEMTPTEVLEREHRVIERVVGTVPAFVAALGQALTAIAGLYRGHIWKQDFVLFPMTNKVLGAHDQRALGAAFAAVDAEVGSEHIRRLEDSAAALAAFADEVGQAVG